MAVPVLAYSTSHWLAAFVNSVHTMSVTIPSGLTDAILVITKSRNKDDFASGFSGITVNGSSAGVTTRVTNSIAAAISHRIWTLNNPTPGTYNIVLTFATSSDDAGLLTAQVWTGVDVSGTPVGPVGSNSSGSGSSPQSVALAASGEKVAIAAYSALGGNTLTPGGGQTGIAASNDSGVSYRAGTTSLSYSWSGTNPTQHAVAGIVLNPAPALPDLSGSASLGDLTASGDISSIASSLAGSATLGDVTASGSLGLAPGVVTSGVFKNWSGTVLAATTIPKVALLRVSDMAQVLVLTNQVTNGSGVLTISSTSLVAGVQYLLVTCNADGTAFGCEPYTAT